MTRWIPSPAMTVACASLVIALGGAGVAAVSQLVPRSSVGTPQLKNDAVVSSKVRNGSLRSVDFAPGQIPVGPEGAKGDKGDPGDRGERGATGPSDAYSLSVAGPVTLPGQTPTAVASLRISQAGKYVIWAKAYFTSGPGMIGCDLRAGDDPDISYFNPGVVTMHTAHEYASAPGTADLVCTAESTGVAYRARIVAIRVANLTVQS